MEGGDEAAVRAELWARREVWRRQQQEGGEEKEEEEKKKLNTFNPPARRSAQPAPAKKPSPGDKQQQKKVSQLLPKRLGLGRVADVGGGEVRGRTRFAAAYKAGTVGQWLRVDQNGSRPDVGFVGCVDAIPLAAALPLCFEGLSESTHPLCLLARRGAARLLEEHPRAAADLPEILPRVVPSLRAALGCKERDVVQVAIAHTATLARVAQAALLDHLDKLLPPLARLAFGSPLSPAVVAAVREIEANVPGSRPKIKAKIPAFD
ncbi:hypothetical protein CTAYLR_005470 [Chrysophaeum taylorii]|uniref:Uncharacterized protein n=1 Tax=Chrysophaeum taylorii TaxID=2483200 RepID=A0AAD7XHC8_9STRA|nr:hypothetical protein CTAYLR_005470 [Chrysophaeum taylorii]